MTNTTNIDALIQAYIKSEVLWTILNLKRAKVSCEYRSAKICADIGYSDHTPEQLFQMRLNLENLETESQRLMGVNCDWSFYAAALLGVKKMEEGDEEANEDYLKDPLTAMKDKLIAAVSDPKNIKRLADLSEEDRYMIVDLGNIFRSDLRKLEDPAKNDAKFKYEKEREEAIVA
jgi:hypothetical protein